MRSVITLSVLLAATVSAQVPDGFAKLWRTEAAVLRKELEASGVVGGSFWFLHEDQVLFREFHGFADLAERRKVDADTIFHWASITKTMTGIVTLQLRDRKQLRLADKIVAHIPALKQVHGGGWDVGTVTLEHLLSHSSGFRGNTFPWGDQKWQPYEPAQWSQLAAMFPYTQLRFEPGTKFSYSNLGIVFVGHVIEQITGEDFEVHVDKNVLKPLGMHRSFFDNTPYHLRRHRSNNYSFAAGEFVANGLDLDTGITVSNGGLNAPIPDMVKYVRFLMGRHGSVLPRKHLESMWQPRFPAGAAGSFTRSMGLTFFLYERKGMRVIGHTGSQKAFQCFFLCDPVAQTAVIAAFNSAANRPEPERQTRAIMLRFLNTTLEKLMPPFRTGR